MSDSGLKLSYSWEDLKPVRPLFVTVLVAQAIGAIASLSVQGLSDWYQTAWFGGALATFPGYLIGLFVQRHTRAGSITSNRSAVLFLGVISLILFIAALTFPRSSG
ncbi:hypothetical protein [Pseudoxanthomonas gei]|uniref:hypothetical protein n=1 Tax=Pseudoxanthomonas gei TaxID=1383030 RepID=UPI001390F193|nr:hypothetical protein [Pseudoxanthomonas gei]